MTKSFKERALHHSAVASQFAAASVGIWIMASAGVLGYGGEATKVERFIGPLIATFATCAGWEILRNVRWINIPLAVALALLAISPWPWEFPTEAVISDVTCAVLVIGLTLMPYPQHQRFGGGWPRAWRTPRL